MMIRPVQLSDAAAIRAIYQPYVTETAITFEVDVPTVQEFERRITKTLTQFSYLVAEVDGKVVGYAYASTYYARAAYDWTTGSCLRREVASTRLLTLSGLYRSSERSEHCHA